MYVRLSVSLFVPLSVYFLFILHRASMPDTNIHTFYGFKFRVSVSQLAVTSSPMMKGPNSLTSVH